MTLGDRKLTSGNTGIRLKLVLPIVYLSGVSLLTGKKMEIIALYEYPSVVQAQQSYPPTTQGPELSNSSQHTGGMASRRCQTPLSGLI